MDMAIRTLVTGISGMVGFILWYFAMVATGMWWVLIAAIYKHGTFGPFDHRRRRIEHALFEVGERA